jgi:hypothetical protein
MFSRVSVDVLCGLQALQSDAHTNKLTRDAALQELSNSMTDLAAQLQASLQSRVFGGMNITMPTLPKFTGGLPKGASGLTGNRSE